MRVNEQPTYPGSETCLPRHLRVLVSPLDWGLGHATRLIPVIRCLVDAGCEVTIAASDASLTLLQTEFPGLPTLVIPGYRVRYPQKGRQFFVKIAWQVPRILWTIAREHFWLREAMQRHRWDAVVSDNRYGLFHPRARCVILTHQVRIRTGHRWLDALLRPVLSRVLERFDDCWVPDMPGEPSLAGDLCHGRMPALVRHIGPLSRFDAVDTPTSTHLLILLSGPEPQRSIFESILRRELVSTAGRVVVVRGLPGGGRRLTDGRGVEWIDHAPAGQLQELISGARLVIARSGYSTVMDLVRMGCPALLVPTPGQPEQEYLARQLSACGLFPTLPQEGFTLVEALRRAGDHTFVKVDFDFGRHRVEVGAWLEAIRTEKEGSHVG